MLTKTLWFGYLIHSFPIFPADCLKCWMSNRGEVFKHMLWYFKEPGCLDTLSNGKKVQAMIQELHMGSRDQGSLVKINCIPLLFIYNKVMSLSIHPYFYTNTLWLFCWVLLLSITTNGPPEKNGFSFSATTLLGRIDCPVCYLWLLLVLRRNSAAPTALQLSHERRAGDQTKSVKRWLAFFCRHGNAEVMLAGISHLYLSKLNLWVYTNCKVFFLDLDM